jgi:hypothetical protein
VRRFAWLVLVAACSSRHDATLQNVRDSDCVSCHLADFQAAAHHAGQSPPTSSCGDCHLNTAWLPATEAHPESLFPIQFGAHSGMACTDCHDATLGSNSGGMNVNCTGCHTGEHSRSRMDSRHREVGSYMWSDTNKQFCRKCHPRGRGD